MEKVDMVNKPPHYQGKVECIDAIESAVGSEGLKSYCAGNVIKYTFRYQKKNGIEDLKKAHWYLNLLIRTIEKDEANKKV